MATVAPYQDRSDYHGQPGSRREQEAWNYSVKGSQEHPEYQPRSVPSRSQNSLRRKANDLPLAPQQSNGNARPPSDPSQRDLGERIPRNVTPGSTKAPSVMDGSYLSPPKGGKFRPALSDKSRSGSEADSLLDLYGHPRSVLDGTDKSERDASLLDLYAQEEDPENSRWIHRDKLAMIESHELQEAGIQLPKQRKSKGSLKHKKSHSRNQSTASSKDQAIDGLATREEKRQKVQPTVRQAAQEDPMDFELRMPKEAASKTATQRGPSAMYSQPQAGKSGSRIPLPKTSPMPISSGYIERSTPLARQRGASGNSLGGDEEGIAYNRMRSRSNSAGSRMLLDEAEVNGTPTLAVKPYGLTAHPISPPSQRVISKAGSVNHSRPRTSNGPRNISEPQKLRPSPSTQKSSPGFPRPKSRNGLEARPATAVNRPEGEAPWLADMYKPDPRLPPEEQMLPTHAKRLQQEQKEREAKAAGLDPSQQQPTSTNSTPERPTPPRSTNTDPNAEPHTPQQQQSQPPFSTPPTHQPREPRTGPPGGQWPLKMAPPIKPPPPSKNLSHKNSMSPTGSTINPDAPHGGYSTIPKVQSTPPMGSLPSPKTGMPQAMVQEKPKAGKGEKGEGEGAGCKCCVVM